MSCRWLLLTLLFLTLVFLTLGFTGNVHALPEYAVRSNIISCTACHFSPTGGGPRNLVGKTFGAHGYNLNPVLTQEYVSADFRALFYYPEKPESNDGMGIMSGSVAGHVALDAEKKIRLVIEANVAGFSAAPMRDTYALFNLSESPSWTDTLMVGRFRIPFGIVTDEHRTYTRLQTATTWNNFQTGAMLSGTPGTNLHYDFAALSGENESGQTLPRGAALRDGAAFNLRWMPGPVLMGVSGLYHDRGPGFVSGKAVSVYTVTSLGRYTNDRVPVSIYLEYDDAWSMDQTLGRDFASPATIDALGNSESTGWLGLVKWDLTPHFALIYKFDFLTPDRTYPADHFIRHGFGFRWFLGPNVMLQARTEFATATPLTETGTATADQSATYGLLQLSL